MVLATAGTILNSTYSNDDTRTEGHDTTGLQPGSILDMRYFVSPIVRKNVIDIDEAIRHGRVKPPAVR